MGRCDRFKEKMAETLELPKDIVMNLSKIVIYENKGAVIENITGLKDVESDKICVRTPKGQIKIAGKSLTIKELGENEINISGDFFSIEFC